MLWLADELRAAGLFVQEYDGWRDRARSSGGFENGRPWLVMWHHSASQASPESDASYCVKGADAAPICNVIIDRDGVVWLLAAGATNTNGSGSATSVSKGTVPADSMNTYAFGMEISNSGVGEPYPQAQIDTAIIVSNVVNRHMGNQPTDVGIHAVYAAGRKIDPAKAHVVEGPWTPHGYNGSTDTWVLDDLMAECAYRAGYHPPPQPEPQPPTNGDTDMASSILILDDVREPKPRYKVGPTSMVWVQDGHASGQINARLDECAGGTRASPIDGFVWKLLTHGDDDVIGSYGPISGPVPAGRDEYGRMV